MTLRLQERTDDFMPRLESHHQLFDYADALATITKLSIRILHPDQSIGGQKSNSDLMDDPTVVDFEKQVTGSVAILGWPLCLMGSGKG